MTVEIIGRACVAPGADSPEALFKLLREERCTVSAIPDDRWDLARFWHPEIGVSGKTYSFAAGVLDSIYDFDPAVFGIARREAMFMDPQQRLLLEMTWRALEDANIPAGSLQEENVGVYVGASSMDHANIMAEDPAAPGPHFMTGNTLSIVSNRISHIFGLNGPSLTVDTACSSSLVALDQAMKALEAGEIDTAIVGGVNVLAHPLSFVGFAQARMLSPAGLCRAYDNDGAGYVRAEGAVVLILRRSDRAAREKDRSHATIIASGINSAGRTNGISLPSAEAQAKLLRAIYNGNDIDPNQIAFIEGHGTGTKVGDPAEIWSLGTVIGTHRSAPVLVGSIKSNIGHTEPASGLFGMMKAMLALEHNYLPASLHFETPNENIDFDTLNVRVADTPIELLKSKKRRLAGINSFGFGGANAHVVIGDPAAAAAAPAKGDADGVFMVSAHSESSLRQLLASYRDAITKAREPAVARAIVAAASANRTPLRHRFAVHSRNPQAVAAAIDDALYASPGLGEMGEAVSRSGKAAFVFSGNGSQWAGMGVAAYQANAEFRRSFASAAALFKVHANLDLVSLLTDPGLEARLADTKIAQPMLFAVQAALSDAFAAMGLRPAAAFGHSVGEVAAAYSTGALSLADAVSVIAKRSLHQDLLAGHGTMAALKLGERDALELIATAGLKEVCVAAINAPNSVTVSGPSEDIRALHAAAKKRKVPCQILDINYPFHHPLIDRVKEAFLRDLPAISPRTSAFTYISTVTGGALEGDRLDAEYWWDNLRQPVRFLDATEEALALGCNVFIEISPRPILSTYVKDTVKFASASASVIDTLSREQRDDAVDPVSKAVARAIAFGAPVDERRVFGGRNAHVKLPPLPFERSDLRPVATSDRIEIFARAKSDPYTLLGWRADPNSASWKNHLDADLFPDIAEHVVDGKSILPASGFIEVAVCAAQQFYGSDRIEISNLEISRPLEIGKKQISELSTILSPETGDLEIRSRERLTDDDWTIHVRARVRKLTPAEGAVELRDLPAGPSAEAGAERAYEVARQFGLDYGPRFQLLDRAVSHGDSIIDVALRPAAKPAHPMLSYRLNPISVDAAFHGLVALFDRLAGEKGGAPYIPVRFGRIHVEKAGVPIRAARIEIVRVSPTSIKAEIALLDDGGRLVAHLGDCRFRRTYLRQHKTLEALSFHYETSAPALADFAPALPRIVPPMPLFAEDASPGLDNASLLYDAAIYRACHEIALKVADGRAMIRLKDLPGDADFRCFLANCLHILADAGFGSYENGHWSVDAEFSLPPVGELLTELAGDRPDRAVEAILINDAYREALFRLDALKKAGRSDVPSADNFISDATFEHQSVHSEAAVARASLLIGALQKALPAAGSGPGPRILELGSLSPSFSRRIATIARERGGSLLVVEPREAARHNLDLEFKPDTHVRVLSPGEFHEEMQADIILSAAPDLPGLLDEKQIGPALRRTIAGCGIFLATANAPGNFSDFAFGLREGWFSRSINPEFPVGALKTAAQWNETLQALGLTQAGANMRELPHGGIITLEARGALRPADEARPLQFSDTVHLLFLREDGAALAASAKSAGYPHVVPVELKADPEKDRSRLSGFLKSLDGSPLHAVFVSPAPGAAEDDALVLQDRILALGALAEAVAAHKGATARLVVIAPGGSPVAGRPVAANSGLWTFLRVLQNEYEQIDVQMIDADGGEPPDMGLIFRAAVDRLSAADDRSGSGDREWMLNAATGSLSALRAVPGPYDLAQRASSDFAAATIRQHAPSQVSSIRWQASHLPEAKPDEVVIEVAATGLNFRDVMWAMGLLPEEALEDGFAGATIGMELSGHVVAVGRDVTDLAPGDAVMAIAPAAFSTHVAVDRTGVARLPDQIAPVAAATMPVAFLTAYYAMVELGRIRKGETILVHGAAGGVGLAAIQVAKFAGAKVIATAGTTEKRRFLEALGVDHVFDSRSLGFARDVLRVTNNEGVDLALNSLFGEAMEQSIALVRPFGRFLELGKRDYYADSKIGLRPFRRNISYFGIDADQLLVNQPELTKRIFGEIGALFAQGTFTPLPYRAFGFDEIGNAFRLMQNAGHIGKIVVLPPVAGRDRVAVQHANAVRIDAGGMHLIVGGIGGFGLAAAEWLVEKGARHIALCSRRGVADEETAHAIRRWKAAGVCAELFACDVTDEQAVADMLAEVRGKAPLRSVVHAAMVLDDALIANLDRARNRPVIDTKAKGAAILDRLTRQDALDNFILFSSATTLVGNPGQANYVAANGYLEGLARTRRREGLPALAVGFGAIADKGYLARNTDVNELLAKRIGRTALGARAALSAVEAYIASAPNTPEAATVMISEFDWNAVRSLHIAKGGLFELIMRSADSRPGGAEAGELDLVAMTEGKSPQEAEDILFEVIATEIAAVLHVPRESILRNQVLKEIGMDSLMAMEVGLSFQQNTGFDMPLSGLTDNTTVGDIARRLLEKVSKRDLSADADEEVEEVKIFNDLSQRHVGQEQAAAL